MDRGGLGPSRVTHAPPYPRAMSLSACESPGGAIESAHHVELPKPERARYERLVQPVVDEAQSAVESGRSLGLSAAVDYALESIRMNNH